MKKVKEIYSEHIGVRLTPTQKLALEKWAADFHLSSAMFVRQVLLNKLDELQKKLPTKK